MGDSPITTTLSFVAAKASSRSSQFIDELPKKSLPKIFSIGFGSTPVFKSVRRMPNGLYETVSDTRPFELMMEAHYHQSFLSTFRRSMLKLLTALKSK